MDGSGNRDPAAQVFLAYSRADRIAARLVCEKIRRAGGFYVWFDEDELLPGQLPDQEEATALRSADAIVVCVSDRGSSIDRLTLFPGLSGDSHHPPVPVFLVRLDECPVGSSLSGYQSIDWFRPEGPDQLLTSLRSICPSDTEDGTAVNQLPAVPTMYGRTGDLAELKQLVEGGAGIVNLYGEPGIGKSALAIHFCRSLRSRYPDAQLYVSGSIDAPLTSFRILMHVGRAFGLVETVRRSGGDAAHDLDESDPSILRDSVRLNLNRRRAVLLVDNVEPAVDIEQTLCDLQGSLIVVTSRTPLARRNAKRYRVMPLDPAASIEMLAELSGRSSTELRHVARECGFRPLLLQLAGSALASTAELTPALYLESLASADSRPADIALTQLDSASRSRWQALTYIPSAFSVGAAASVWNDEEGAAEAVLADFVTRRLVEKNRRGRYSVHDLLKNAARDAPTADVDRHEVLYRYAQSLAELAEAAEDALRSRRRVDENWMDRLDCEEAGFDWLFSSVKDASGSATHNVDPRCESAAMRVAGALFWYWNFKGAFSQACVRVQNCLEACSPATPEPVRGKLCYSLSGLSFMLGEFDTAIQAAQEAQRIWMRLGDSRSSAYATVVLGMITLEMTYLNSKERAYAGRRAATLQRRAVKQFRTAGDDWGLALAHTDLGRALSRYDYVRAEHTFRQSLRLWKKQQDEWGLELALNAWGTAAKEHGSYDVAQALLHRSADLQRKVGDLWGLASCSLDLAACYMNRGNIAAALPALRQSLEIHARLGRKAFISRCLTAISEIAIVFGQHQRADILKRTAVEMDTLALTSPVAAEISDVVPETNEWLREQEDRLSALRQKRSGRRFLVGLSFPGEARERAEPIATMLAYQLGPSSVLYDRWYEEEFARVELDLYLRSLYKNEADLITVFACRSYSEKAWCGVEWRVIRSVINAKERDRVMLLRLEDCQLEGLDWSVDGFMDISLRSNAEVAAAVMNRLALVMRPVTAIEGKSGSTTST